ncbi:unnamed protein product, partial [Ectocarpus sp. 12 AP-2014]
ATSALPGKKQSFFPRLWICLPISLVYKVNSRSRIYGHLHRSPRQRWRRRRRPSSCHRRRFRCRCRQRGGHDRPGERPAAVIVREPPSRALGIGDRPPPTAVRHCRQAHRS